ncbi:unnamed protein product [Schistosoma mattheei]|uniref:Uncharacterized protein n=1 Tax=Schistosoma mattheei TaxID=31246 RepID=A0A183Q1I9_9TREM|nr:unnamed protein product [Schistosoma mattheei]
MLLIPASNARRIVFLDLALFRFPSGFQVNACLVMQFDDFRNVMSYPFPLKTATFTLICDWKSYLLNVAHFRKPPIFNREYLRNNYRFYSVQ